MIVVRPYRRTDCGILRTIFIRAVSEIAINDYTAEQIRIWAVPPPDFAERLAAGQVFVAEMDGAVAGFSDLDDAGHIDFLYVNPDHQRKGVAKALLNFIIERAQRAGTPRLFSEVSLTARASFEQAGFRKHKAQTVIVNGCAFRNFVMELRLRSNFFSPADLI